MSSTELTGSSPSSSLGAPDPANGVAVPQWFAVYVQARHEKSVAKRLEERCVDQFLPLYETTHRWKNGRHAVQLPLFSSYIFVHIAPSEKLSVLQVPGVGYIVGSHGIPTALPLQDIERLRSALRRGVVAQPFPYLKVGTRVEIQKGPLQGLVGVLKRCNGQCRVVISVDLIMQSVAVEVDATDVVPIRTKTNYRS